MADVLADGMAWLDAQLRAHASESVTYSRDPYGDLEILATRGSKPMRTMADFGPRIDFTVQDWFIAASELVIDGEPATPRKGDRIYAISRGMLQTYEVLSPGGDEPAWRWSDASEVTLRVHTKLKAEEAYA